MKKKILKSKARRAPLVSVVMPVYNAEKYLDEAIHSILSQSFQDFEFIIVDDRSTDSSWKIIKRYAKENPEKIKVFRNKKNVKQAETVNFAIKHAQGRFIARMDADDIALPQRLEKQVKYLRSHRKTVAVGSQCFVIDAQGNITGEKTFPTSFEEIYKYIFKFCPAQQPTFMINRSLLPDNFEFYNHALSPVEDVEFLFQLFKFGRVENMPNYLLLYRIHGENSSLKNFRKSFYLTMVSRIRAVLFYGYKPEISGVIFTIAQAFAVFMLPQVLNRAIYKLIKGQIDNKQPRALATELSYQA